MQSRTPTPVIYSRNEHNISRQSIDPDALKILYRLLRAGYKAYLVGGGVRDLLLGLKPKDFDIGTDAKPDDMRALFRNSRVIGRRFRLVHVFFRGNKIIEVATFRTAGTAEEEGENGNGEAATEARNNKEIENIYGTDATDAFRRDLTINALFYDIATYSVIDYVGGVKDLQDGIIRIIGDPDKRFAEDPVRLIRTVRHAARTGFRIEPITWESLLRCRHLILESSQVRVYEELKKDLKSGHILKILRRLLDAGLLQFMIPEFTENEPSLLAEGSALAHCLALIDQLVLSGREISATTVLSLLTLYMGTKDIFEMAAPRRFRSKDEVREHCNTAFCKLSVPRKERERIQNILIAWAALAHSDLDRIRPASYANKEFLPDLKTLLEIAGTCDADDEILRFLHHISRSGENSGKQRQRQSRGRDRQQRNFQRKPRVRLP